MKALNKKWVIVFVLSISSFANAQAPGFDDDVNDVPIDDWIIPLAIVGVIFFFFYQKNKRKAVK